MVWREGEDVGLRAVPTAVRGGWEELRLARGEGRGRRYGVEREVLRPGPQPST